MSSSSTSGTTYTGRSPDAALIHQEFLKYHAELDVTIGKLDLLHKDPKLQAAAKASRGKIIQLHKDLHQAYSKKHEDARATLGDFKKCVVEINRQATLAFNKALGKETTLSDSIEEQHVKAQKSIETLAGEIKKHEASIAALSVEAKKIKAQMKPLEEQIAKEVHDDPKGSKSSAHYKLDEIKASLQEAETEREAGIAQLDTLRELFENVTHPEDGTLPELTKLAKMSEPRMADLTQARKLVGEIQEGLNYAKDILEATLQVVREKQRLALAAISPVQKVALAPATGSIRIENGAWYIDWTRWDFPVPKGVNKIRVFTGNMRLNEAKKPVVDGFDCMSTSRTTGKEDFKAMADFIDRCLAKDIEVDFSIGGGGGRYDHCWDALTDENVPEFAKAYADFTSKHRFKGADFDYESSRGGIEQHKRVGRLIKEYKAINPQFQTSVCTNAGFGPNFPWQKTIETILDAASTEDPITKKKTCAVERLNIMSYYNSIAEEKAWITGWATWLKERYNFTPSQGTVGLNNTDSHAYDIEELADWAKSQGYSTWYWSWDSARQAHSDESTTKIKAAYDRGAH